MNRFVKRFMKRRKGGPSFREKRPTAMDSASQRFVTVRQVFPDDPAAKRQAPFCASAAHPFASGGYLTLPERYSCAPRLYLQRFKFMDRIVSLTEQPVNPTG